MKSLVLDSRRQKCLKVKPRATDGDKKKDKALAKAIVAFLPTSIKGVDRPTYFALGSGWR